VSERPDSYAIDTLLGHAGGDPAAREGAVNPPVYRASTFLFPTVAEWEASRDPRRRFDMIRYGQLATPTTLALEEAIATLEGGYRAMLLPSGLAAVTVALQALLNAGDHVLVTDAVYPPTRHFCDTFLNRFGVATTYFDPHIGARIAELFQANTRVVFLESPDSMSIEVQDVPAIARAAHAANVQVLLDNSWGTPYLFRAFEHGVDVSILAATKYIGGHSDVIGGALVVSDAQLAERLAFHQNSLGAVAGPFDAWLTLRGIKTLAVRMERHCQNAAAVAHMLAEHPKVSEVRYPGLPGHQGHEIAAKQMRGFGGMVSFRHADGEAAAVEMCGRTRLFTLGESLGGVESLIEHPGRMTHMSAAGSPLEVPGDLVRLSVGIEDRADLLADLAQALG
jgi:cystathionine gamma-synthase